MDRARAKAMARVGARAMARGQTMPICLLLQAFVKADHFRRPKLDGGSTFYPGPNIA